MTISEIKSALANGKTVYHQSLLYKVVTGFEDQLYIECSSNKHRIGMEADNGEMINAKPYQFFMEDSPLYEIIWAYGGPSRGDVQWKIVVAASDRNKAEKFLENNGFRSELTISIREVEEKSTIGEMIKYKG